MMNRLFLSMTAAVIATVALTSVTNAAVITYVGLQSNVESLSNDAAVGWRNASTAKLFDADGDSIIGTDGYDFAGSSAVQALPTYVTSVANAGGHNDKNKGVIDDPTNASGADIGTGWNGSGGQTIVFNANVVATDTVRIGVLFDGTWSLAWGTQTMTLSQTAGSGSDSVTSPTLTLAGDGLDVVYFDVTGIQDGDTFLAKSNKVSIGWSQITGVAFDTVGTEIPEPASLAMGLMGLTLIAGRRRRA